MSASQRTGTDIRHHCEGVACRPGDHTDGGRRQLLDSREDVGGECALTIAAVEAGQELRTPSTLRSGIGLHGHGPRAGLGRP